MIIYKRKGKKYDQASYDFLFHSIENNLRELGLGDVSVNKKMKELNKILYDILLKLENKLNQTSFKISRKLIIKYFNQFNNQKSKEFITFETYLSNFYDFCFELPLENMVRSSINFIK